MSQNDCKEVGSIPKILAVISAEFGKMHDKVLDNIIKSHSEEYILEKIDYTKNKTQKGATGFYPVGYFISALKHDYKSSSAKNKPEPEKAVERPAKEGSWEERLSELKISKAHWQKMLEFAKRSGNPQTITEIEVIVSDCGRKLSLHLLEKQKLATEDKISPEMAASIGSHPSANLYYSAVVNG
jgi:hypothetical protein